VIVLAKAALSFARVSDARVFIGRGASGNPWNLKDAPSAGFHDAVEFAKALGVVGDVLEYVVAEYHVKAVGFQWNLMEVKVYVGQRRFDVSREHLEVRKGFKAMVEALFGRDVK